MTEENKLRFAPIKGLCNEIRRTLKARIIPNMPADVDGSHGKSSGYGDIRTFVSKTIDRFELEHYFVIEAKKHEEALSLHESELIKLTAHSLRLMRENDELEAEKQELFAEWARQKIELTERNKNLLAKVVETLTNEQNFWRAKPEEFEEKANMVFALECAKKRISEELK